MAASEMSSGLEHALQVQRDERAKKYPLPRPSKPGDVGYDLVCVETIVVPRRSFFFSLLCFVWKKFESRAHPIVDVPTGVRIKLPSGTWGEIKLRSSAHRRFARLELCSAPIDNGYTGPMDPRFRNRSFFRSVVIMAGESPAQLVLHPLLAPITQEVETLPETARGADRYGSTGK